jgi:hypothetical protein
MNVSERDRRAIGVGTFAVVGLGVYFLVIEPLAVRYSAMVRAHRNAAIDIKHNGLESQELSVREGQVKAWEEKAGTLVPERLYGEQMTAVGSNIIAAAGESQIQLQGAAPATPTPWVDTSARSMAAPGPGEPPLAQAVINIDAQGGWENAFKFMAALYRIDGVLSVEQLEITGDPKQGDKLKLRLAVSVLMKASAEGKRS